MIEKHIILEDIDPVVFYGVGNAHLQMIKSLYPKLRIVARDNIIRVLGDEEEMASFEENVEKMRRHVLKYNNINDEDILDIIKGRQTKEEGVKGVIVYNISGKPIKCKSENQQKLVDAFENNDMIFATGPAGTGKTYLSIALAVRALKEKAIRKIILSRPAVEAGEKLGFLPGDLQSKVDPYLRPLYDALYQIMGAESFQKNMEKGLIEVAPLAYMRGRTLDNAFIILDEAQNTTPAQMKMFLTRIGFGSKAVITGDATQKDLSPGTTSGLDVALKVLKKVDEIGICELTSQDVVRHPVVQKIVKAYEDYENRNKKKPAEQKKKWEKR